MKGLKELVQDKFDLKDVTVAPDLIEKEVNITVETNEFFDYAKSKINVDRIGEVVFAIKENEKLFVVRQKEYPDEVYRIPSGGINFCEGIAQALKREAKEELGLIIKKFMLIGIIKYNLIWLSEHLHFYSFIFLVESYEEDRDAQTDGEISEVIKVSLDELKRYSNILKELRGFWGDWGRFRHFSTQLVYEYLAQKKIS